MRTQSHCAKRRQIVAYNPVSMNARFLSQRRKSLGLAGLAIATATGLSGCETLPSKSPAPSPRPAAGPPSSESRPPITSNLSNRPQDLPPILFVHGTGDSSGIWMTTAWRFESNGWPSNRLFAIDFAFPLPRTNDNKPQPGRSSSAEQLAELSAEVSRILQQTGARKIILIGSSRGGLAIRNYIRNGAGKDTVLAALLCGTPNHGIYRSKTLNPQNEFNAEGDFLTQLNRPYDNLGNEVPAHIPFLTIRSNNNDKFAQPDGRWIGQPGMATGVSYDSPALKGATNVILNGRDHRELAFHSDAFAEMFRFLTNNLPPRPAVVREEKVILNGKIMGHYHGGKVGGQGELTNLPLPGARVSIFEVAPDTGERRGGALHMKTVGADGFWGPFTGNSRSHYEFVIEHSDFSITHVYRSPFARSSSWINFRPVRNAPLDREGFSVITMTRPRGYFGVGRDQIRLDSLSPPPDISPGVASQSSAKIKITVPTSRPVVAEFNSERIVVRPWPSKENRHVIAEFTD